MLHANVANHSTAAIPGSAESVVPFVALPLPIMEMVAAGKLGVMAAYLYAVLLKHLNHKQGHVAVWPKRKTLAEWMGFAKVDSVDRHLDELVAAGLVVKTSRAVRGMRASCSYELKVLATGPRSAQRGPESRESAAQHVTPSTGVRYPAQGVTVTPCAGVQYLEEVEQDEVDLKESSALIEDEGSFAPSLTRTGYESEKQDPIADEDHARELLDDACVEDEDIDEVLDFLRAPKADGGREVRSPGQYLQRIRDTGGPSGITAIADTAAGWTYLRWNITRGHELAAAVKARHPRLRNADQLATACTAALEAGAPENNLLATLENAHRRGARASCVTYVRAVDALTRAYEDGNAAA